MRSAGTIADYMSDHASTTEEQKAWSDGGANKALLHGLVGAATAALGGGDALQGALGAGAGEAVSAKMQEYLQSKGINPNSSEGKALMELASAAIGGMVGGGVGAVTALQGEQYNRQLHVRESDWIKTNAAKYAALHPGMTVEQAEAALAQQAYRQVQSGAAGAWDSDASAFLKTAGRDLWTDPSMPGETFLMFQATSFDQRKDTGIFANAQQADLDFYARNGLQPATSEQAEAWEQMRFSETKRSAIEAGAIMAGSVAAPALVEASPAIVAWGTDGLAAYRAAVAGYSLSAAATSGALGSGAMYTGGATVGAFYDWRTGNALFSNAFDKRFSYLGLGASMAVGAGGGVYATKMFQWAGLPNSMGNWATIDGAVIRVNKMAAGWATGKMVHSSVNQKDNPHEK